MRGIDRIKAQIDAMDDQELRETMKSDLSIIGLHLKNDDITPVEDGLAPKNLAAQFPPAFSGHASALEYKSERVRLIREMLPQRAEAAKVEKENKKAAAKELLTGVLDAAEGDARKIVEAAEASRAATERLRQLVSDIQTAGMAAQLAGLYSPIKAAVMEASSALGKPAPELPPLPAELLGREEFQTIISLLAGRSGGFNSPGLGISSKYHRTNEVARELRNN